MLKIFLRSLLIRCLIKKDFHNNHCCHFFIFFVGQIQVIKRIFEVSLLSSQGESPVQISDRESVQLYTLEM